MIRQHEIRSDQSGLTVVSRVSLPLEPWNDPDPPPPKMRPESSGIRTKGRTKYRETKWTDEDYARLAHMKARGASVAEIGADMGRSKGSITGAWARYRKGEHNAER